ncbi:hypothetical protein S40293_11240 [Stachybotrys chartarum IBT 40293]|nr:hypothetical protein S40293_11240 [Stachybotrys chartarum IBT 40293]
MQRLPPPRHLYTRTVVIGQQRGIDATATLQHGRPPPPAAPLSTSTTRCYPDRMYSNLLRLQFTKVQGRQALSEAGEGDSSAMAPMRGHVPRVFDMPDT